MFSATEPRCTGSLLLLLLPKKKKKLKIFPDLQKTFFDSQSLFKLLSDFPFFKKILLQVIKVIKLHDKTSSEMVLIRPVGDFLFFIFLTLAVLAWFRTRTLSVASTTRRSSYKLRSEPPAYPQFTGCPPACQRCLSIPVHPTSPHSAK